MLHLILETTINVSLANFPFLHFLFLSPKLHSTFAHTSCAFLHLPLLLSINFFSYVLSSCRVALIIEALVVIDSSLGMVS